MDGDRPPVEKRTGKFATLPGHHPPRGRVPRSAVPGVRRRGCCCSARPAVAPGSETVLSPDTGCVVIHPICTSICRREPPHRRPRPGRSAGKTAGAAGLSTDIVVLTDRSHGDCDRSRESEAGLRLEREHHDDDGEEHRHPGRQDRADHLGEHELLMEVCHHGSLCSRRRRAYRSDVGGTSIILLKLYNNIFFFFARGMAMNAESCIFARRSTGPIAGSAADGTRPARDGRIRAGARRRAGCPGRQADAER